MAREMTRNNPLVMQGAGRLVANVVGRGRMNPWNRRKQRERSGVFLPLLSPLPPVQNSSDLQFANLVAAKIQSCYTILREMDAGAPVLPFAGGGDHSETTETRPDGETRIWRVMSSCTSLRVPPRSCVADSERIQRLLMTSRTGGTWMPASWIACRFRIAFSRKRSWSALVANESSSEVTPQSSSSTQKSAVVITGTRIRARSSSTGQSESLSVWSAVMSLACPDCPADKGVESAGAAHGGTGRRRLIPRLSSP